MPQFFMQKEMKPGQKIEIIGSDAKHILKSLRLKTGDWIMLSDGCGKTFQAKIVQTSLRAVHAIIEREIMRNKGVAPPALALALANRERFEWAIQKTIELGCQRIIPFLSERSEKISAAIAARKLERWQKIAIEAAKQSGLPFLPVIEPPIEYNALCARIKNMQPCFIFYEGEKKQGLNSVLSNSKTNIIGLIIIGPEGGFTDNEISMAKKSGAFSVSLGQQILRVETAAIAAMAICQYELDNMSPFF